MKNSFRILGAATATIVVVASAAAVAQSAGAAAIKARQANFKQLGGAFKAINDELKKEAPDKRQIAANAAKMATLAPQIPRWFPKDSGPEVGVKTGAKPDIWSDPRAFADAARALPPQTVKLQQIAAAGDLDGLRQHVRATGGACKGCHDKFRVDEKKP